MAESNVLLSLIGSVGIINLIMLGVAWGRLSQSQQNLIKTVANLDETVKKQNGSIVEIRKSEADCSLKFEHRVSGLEANQDNVIAKVGSLELHRNSEGK